MAAFILTGRLPGFMRYVVHEIVRGRSPGPASENILPNESGKDAEGGNVANDVAQVTRIYSVEDGTTRMEQVQVPLGESANGVISKLLAGPGVMIRRSTAGRFAPWHPAPRRQMIVTLGGWGEMETGDGQRVRVLPGMMAVVEDVAGVGHQTWTDPTDGWYMLFIPLDDDTALV
jgi:hypothetical protein